MNRKVDEKTTPCKPEWEIILKHLVYQDQNMLYRICRKMIIYLNRLDIDEIKDITNKLYISEEQDSSIQRFGPNWPKPKGSPFDAGKIIYDVFQIAAKYIDDDYITKLLTQWMRQENLGFLSNTLEKRHAPLSEVVDAFFRYLRLTGPNYIRSQNERIGLRVSLISRFLSDNLNYINIAKNYINIDSMRQVIERVVGPAQGNGKLGGKSAGLILAYQILLYHKNNSPLLEKVLTPKSWFLTSDGLLEFVHYNALEEFVFSKYLPSEEIKQEYPFITYIFKNSLFPPEFLYAFNMIVDDLEGKPIVVRSSSLLEDSFEASFSGKYKSLFVANTGTRKERLAALSDAVAEVYASTFGPDPIEYRKERGLIDFREEMGILIQEVVGTKIGKYFCPSYAGVAFSQNEFRWSHRINRNDGIVRLVTGLGTRAVDRTMSDYPRLVSPGQPMLKVNSSLDETIKYSQHYIDVINLETNSFETIEFEKLIYESNGYFPGLEKIVSFDRSGMLVEPLGYASDFTKEKLVVTFNSLIEKSDFIPTIKEIMKILNEAFGGPVDVEFASDGVNFYLLQCRPQSLYESDKNIRIPTNIPQECKVFSANQYVSCGLIKDIEYIVYVDSQGYSKLSTIEEMYDIGKIVSRLNRILPRRKFILIGPGRWGSKGDIKLGVPVIYSDINNTAMLIEVAREKEGYLPDLSFGTHFFQDLVEANIKYLPLYPDKKDIIFNENFFMNSHNILSELIPEYEQYSSIVRIIKISNSDKYSTLSIYMDGEACQALAVLS